MRWIQFLLLVSIAGCDWPHWLRIEKADWDFTHWVGEATVNEFNGGDRSI